MRCSAAFRRSPLGAWLFCGVLLATAGLAQRPNFLSFEEGEEGWLLMFYGSSLDGWSVAGDARWDVVAGELRPHGGVGFLVSEDVYGEFEMKVDFLVDPGADGGVVLRSTAEPRNPLHDGYELNIAPPSDPFPTGSLVGHRRVEGVEERDEWRTLQVEAVGGSFKAWVDDRLVLEHEVAEPIAKGHIVLRYDSGVIRYRNVKVRWLAF